MIMTFRPDFSKCDDITKINIKKGSACSLLEDFILLYKEHVEDPEFEEGLFYIFRNICIASDELYEMVKHLSEAFDKEGEEFYCELSIYPIDMCGVEDAFYFFEKLKSMFSKI